AGGKGPEPGKTFAPEDDVLSLLPPIEQGPHQGPGTGSHRVAEIVGPDGCQLDVGPCGDGGATSSTPQQRNLPDQVTGAEDVEDERLEGPGSRDLQIPFQHDVGPVARITLMEERLAGGQSKDRKSTRLNSSHVKISYAAFCLSAKTLMT